MSFNPYASPETSGQIDAPLGSEHDRVAGSAHHQLAGRWTRFAAALVDGLLLMAITMPVTLLTGFAARFEAQEVSFLEQMTMSLLGIAMMLLVNGYPLATRGQTIGKMVTNIQIVDVQTGGLLPFLRVYVYRYLWMLPLSVVVELVPGKSDNHLVSIVGVVNTLFIFGPARRCLHDYIAGSKVVLYQANRTRVA